MYHLVGPDDFRDRPETGNDWSDMVCSNVEQAKELVDPEGIGGRGMYATELEAAAAHIVNALDTLPTVQANPAQTREATVQLFLALWLQGAMR